MVCNLRSDDPCVVSVPNPISFRRRGYCHSVALGEHDGHTGIGFTTADIENLS